MCHDAWNLFIRLNVAPKIWEHDLQGSLYKDYNESSYVLLQRIEQTKCNKA